MDTYVCAFKEFQSADKFPLENFFFDREKVFDWSSMKQILRKDEDKDKEANEGLFSVHPSFNLIILTDMSNIETDD